MSTTQPNPATRVRQPRFPLGAWYIHCFISEFVLIYPTYLIMMEQSGIGPAQLGVLLMIWSATLLVFEVPSGVLGDLFPRKRIIMIGGCIEALAFLTWLFFPSFWGFALGFVIWSFGASLSSGTSEAYLYEALNDPAEFDKVYGRTEAIESLGVAAALLCGGFAAVNGFTLPLLLSLLAPVIGALVMLVWLPDLDAQRENAKKDAKKDAETSRMQDFFATFMSGTKTILARPNLRFLILASATLGAIAGVYEEYIGVFFVEREFNIEIIGIVYAGVWFSRTIGTFFAHRLAGTNLLTPLILFSVTGFALAMSGYLDNVTLLLLALFAYFGQSGTMDVVYGAALQRRVEDHHRATITSYMSMSLETVAVFYFLVFGLLGEAYNWRVALTVGAIASVILSLVWCARYATRRQYLLQKDHSTEARP